ncbi:MAG: hypothetical protein OHK0012_18070 [Synechococcales cyanobacterium]
MTSVESQGYPFDLSRDPLETQASPDHNDQSQELRQILHTLVTQAEQRPTSGSRISSAETWG